MKVTSEFILGYRKGNPILIQKISESCDNWCVQFAGNGHYFKDFESLVEYLKQRKWVK